MYLCSCVCLLCGRNERRGVARATDTTDQTSREQCPARANVYSPLSRREQRPRVYLPALSRCRVAPAQITPPARRSSLRHCSTTCTYYPLCWMEETSRIQHNSPVEGLGIHNDEIVWRLERSMAIKRESSMSREMDEFDLSPGVSTDH